MHAPFPSTPWSLVLQAADPASPHSREALGQLIDLSWRPLYAFLRRDGHSAHAAEDLTQGFLTRLVEKELLSGLSAGRGRFRNFLLVCLKRYVANERERESAVKRGGGRTLLPLEITPNDWRQADRSYLRAPADDQTPEREFERRWALAMLDRALSQVADEWRDAGKPEQFKLLSVYLTGDRQAPPHEETANELGTTPGAVKTAVHRLRAQFREALCHVVGETLDRPELLEDELRQLFRALSP